MLKASIDLGTNTCLLLIAEWDENKKEVASVLGDFANVVRLGEGVDKTKEFSKPAMDRAYACLKKYCNELEKFHLTPAQTICVATSQARDAKNSLSFFSEIKSHVGFDFQILSGSEEAGFTFTGALLPDMNAKETLVIDIGGGSSEIMSAHSGMSLDVGSVRFTERFLKSDPVTDNEFWNCQKAIDEVIDHNIIKHLPWREKNPSLQLLAVAGTATTLAQLHLNLKQFDANQIDSCLLTRGDVHRMVEELKWRTISERLSLPGVGEGRADVLLAGALILWRVMEIFNFTNTRVSTRGLRFGVFV
ncbi:MAG: hypothetical protein HY843_08395 [Bdellovibrio sp.]|nr:hypothetical protein [Bdellovibrio sp.]